VKVTKEVYEYGKKNGHVIVTGKNGGANMTVKANGNWALTQEKPKLNLTMPF
jgi:hypothetical protein